MSILHIDSSARNESSNSRRITAYIVERLKLEMANDSDTITRDLGQQPLPHISAEDLVDLHASNFVERPSLMAHVELSNQLIAELKSAETLVIGAPLYNFGVPVALKQWIDYVARSGQTFHYTAQGPVGLSGVKKAFVVVTSGGTPIGSSMDHLSAYLKTVLGFLGVESVVVIEASGSKGEPEKIIAEAKAQFDELFRAEASAAALTLTSGTKRSYESRIRG